MSKQRKKVLGIVALTLGILLIGGAGFLQFRNLQEEDSAQKTATTVLNSIQEKFTQEEPAPSEPLFSDPVAPAVAAPVNPLQAMPVFMVDGIPYVGALELPTLGLELPIIRICTDDNLKKAPCCYTGATYSNDLVIAGHNYRSHFATLGNLAPGDPIYFIDMDQTTFSYTVSEVEVLQPTAIRDMITNDNWDLTLFTCAQNNNVRIAVRCVETAK